MVLHYWASEQCELFSSWSPAWCTSRNCSSMQGRLRMSYIADITFFSGKHFISAQKNFGPIGTLHFFFWTPPLWREYFKWFLMTCRNSTFFQWAVGINWYFETARRNQSITWNWPAGINRYSWRSKSCAHDGGFRSSAHSTQNIGLQTTDKLRSIFQRKQIKTEWPSDRRANHSEFVSNVSTVTLERERDSKPFWAIFTRYARGSNKACDLGPLEAKEYWCAAWSSDFRAQNVDG